MSEYTFPYRWDKEAKVDALLNALIKKDFVCAERLIAQGMKLEKMDESTFKRALYEFLADYETMEFLVKHRFNKLLFPYISCVDGNQHIWGLVGRAYFLNDRKLIELLFSAGFDVFNQGDYWGEDTESLNLWSLVLLKKFDKELLDWMLGYGCPLDYIWIHINDPENRHKLVYEYLSGNPPIQWKGYSLCLNWRAEIPEPEKPHFKIFTSRAKREMLQKKYEREMYDYENKKRLQRKFIDDITQSEWLMIEEKKRAENMAHNYWMNLARKKGWS